MKKACLPVLALALVLALCLTLSGCASGVLSFLNDRYGAAVGTHFADMAYQRPDPAALQHALDTACRTAETGDAAQTLQAIFDYYDLYDNFSTGHALSYIHYSCDMTDLYWQEEYSYCAEHLPLLETSLETLYDFLADCPLRQELEERYFGEGFFTYYDDDFIWDDAMLTLLEQEAALQEHYYTICEEADQDPYDSEAYFDRYFLELTEILVQLAAIRQQIALEAGYDDYVSFAFDYYHARSYSPSQAKSYLLAIAETLVAPYRQLAGESLWDTANLYCSSADTFAYVQDAANAMGGTPAKAFRQLQLSGLYHISPGQHKNPSSFETYLWSYAAPFVFVDPYMDQTDKLAFAHEFGHFANDYACGGSYAQTDVAEIHSQGFEYLSLCYSQDSEALARYKLAESLCVYVEQAAYALFELELYGLSAAELTADNVAKLYADICQSFGLDSYSRDPRDLITIPHFYTEPMYIMSYVVSNDLAMQLYQLELEKPGEGLALYEQCLMSEDADIQSFMQTYGLTDPLSDRQLENVAAFFEKNLFYN